MRSQFGHDKHGDAIRCFGILSARKNIECEMTMSGGSKMLGPAADSNVELLGLVNWLGVDDEVCPLLGMHAGHDGRHCRWCFRQQGIS